MLIALIFTIVVGCLIIAFQVMVISRLEEKLKVSEERLARATYLLNEAEEPEEPKEPTRYRLKPHPGRDEILLLAEREYPLNTLRIGSVPSKSTLTLPLRLAIAKRAAERTIELLNESL